MTVIVMGTITMATYMGRYIMATTGTVALAVLAVIVMTLR